MKNTRIIIYLSFALSCAGSIQIYSQKPIISSTGNTAQGTSTKMLNLVNTPIAIENDLEADRYFQKALTDFKAKNIPGTVTQIRTGALELLKEAPVDIQNPQRKLVEQRIGELYGLSLQVEAGLVHDPETLENVFADADESLAHRYYESTNTLIDGTPDSFADRLLGMSVHLRNSKEYHNSAEKSQIGDIANEAADLAASIRKMKPGERELSPALKVRLNKLLAAVKALKLDE